jgi:predicted nucleic acid-binding protein
MVTYILDSSAILRYLDGEGGAGRVSEIIKGHLAGRCEVVVAALHWGEVAGITARVHGRKAMDLVLSRLLAFGFQIVPASADRAVAAALIRVDRGLSYVDAFGPELATASPDGVFVTADFDFKAVDRDVKIEFLPKK